MMLDEPKLFFNLVTRDALLIADGQAHLLEGPFSSREDAERASEQFIEHLAQNSAGDAGRPDNPRAQEGERALHH
jgi:hypothetical protein